MPEKVHRSNCRLVHNTKKLTNILLFLGCNFHGIYKGDFVYSTVDVDKDKFSAVYMCVCLHIYLIWSEALIIQYSGDVRTYVH